MMLLLVKVLHLGLELGRLVADRFVEGVPLIMELAQVLQQLSVIILGKDDFEHSVCAVDLGVDEVLVDDLLSLLLLIVLILVVELINGFSVLLEGKLSHLFVDQLVVQVLQILESLNGVELVVLLVLPDVREGVIGHIQYFKLVLEGFQILN